MFKVGAISGDLLLNINPFKRAAQEALTINGRLKRDFAQVSTAAANFGAALSNISRDLAIAGTAITGFSVLSVRAASNFAETANLFDVAFENAADEARAWAKDIAQSLGLFEEDVLKTAGTLKVMIGSMGLADEAASEMSKNLTLLAADFSSFYNIDHESAFQKIRAGLSGEAEPLKQLGILVNETTVQNYAWANGIAQVGKELTETQKVVARYGVMLESSKKAQGDLIRTSDSASNQFRRLQNQARTLSLEFGEALLPAVNSIVIGFNQYIGGAIAIARQNPELIEQIAKIVTVTGMAAAALGGIGLIAGPVVRALKLIAASAGLAWAAIFSGPVVVAAAVTAIVVAIGKLASDWELLKREITRAMGEMDSATGKWVSSAIGHLKEYGKAIFNVVVSINEMLDAEKAFAVSTAPMNSASSSQPAPVTPKAPMFEQFFNDIWNALKPELDATLGMAGTMFGAVLDKLGLENAKAAVSDAAASIEDIKKQLTDALANPVMPEYTTPDYTKLLFGASETEFDKGAKAAADKAARTLEEQRDRAVGVFQKMNPASAVLEEFVQSVDLLEKFDLMNAALGNEDNLKRFAESLFGGLSEATNDEIADVIEMIHGMGEAGVVTADAMRRAWLEAIDDIDKRLMEGVLEPIDTMQQDMAKAAEEKVKSIRSAMNDFAQSFGQVGQALGGVNDRFKGVTKAIQGIQIAVQLAGTGLQLFKTISAAVAASVRLSWEDALGIFGLVLEMIYQLISAFGLLGNKGQKELKGIAKVIDEVKEASNAWIDDLADRIVQFARTGEATFKEFVDSVLDDLARIALSELFISPIVKYIGDILPGFAKGGVFDNGNVVPFARGGVVSKPVVFPMASGMGLMGEAGPEAVMPLKRGRDGRLGVASSGGNVNIQINNYSGAQVDARESTGADGTRNIEVVIRNVMRKALRAGEFNRDFEGLFGLTRRPA